MTNPLATAQKGARTVPASSLADLGGTSQAFSTRPPPPDQYDELVGTVLNGTYVVERCIGEGGMGRVYEASHTRITNKRFAIKVLLPEFARNSEVIARFHREAEATASIAHPNVIGVYDVDRTPEGLAYLVCDMLTGVDLAEHLEAVGRIAPQAAVHLGIQLCDALAAAHSKNVIHRDLKPQNIFLLGDRSLGKEALLEIRVLDFGLSRFADGASDQLTKTGFIMGTPSYMSPEQAHGQRGDHRIDIYGAGAILYAALTGKAPFERSTPQLTILGVMNDEPPRLRSLEASVPESLELIVQRAMAKKPEDRYQDAATMAQALRELDAAQAVQANKPARPALESQISLDAQADMVRKARPRLVALLLLAVILSLAVFSVAITGLELLLGFGFSRVEFFLVMLVVLGTSLAPSISIVSKLRRAWSNSARVIGYIDRLVWPLIFGTSAYGLAALMVRVSDEALARYQVSPLGNTTTGSGFAGWSLLLSLVGLLVAGGTVLQSFLKNRARSRLELWLVRVGSPGVMVLLSIGILLAGAEWRHQYEQAPPTSSSALTTTFPAAPKQSAEQAKELAEASHSTVPKPPLDSKQPQEAPRPTDTELAQAVALGVEGLLPLADRYPNEPLVLMPLMSAFATHATGRRDAMAIAKQLLELDPTKARDTEFESAVKLATATPGEASEQAIELLARRMGSRGLDLLWELAEKEPKVKAKADQLLADPQVREEASPALAIAYDLREAKACADRMPMLTRAENLGDERSVEILRGLSTGTKRGCGKWKRQPCNPACVKEAAAFRETIAAIGKRLQAN